MAPINENNTNFLSGEQKIKSWWIQQVIYFNRSAILRSKWSIHSQTSQVTVGFWITFTHFTVYLNKISFFVW